MSNHTPGPWRVVDRRNRDWAALHIDAQPDSKGVYSVASVGGVADMPESEREANARLIAAAPQLLEALEEAEKDLVACSISIHRDLVHRGNTMWEGVPEILDARIKHIRTAIAAAKGEGK